MGTKASFVVLVLIVAAMLAGTKLYTDARFQSSQDAVETEASYCQALRNGGGATTGSDRERCDRLWSRTFARNDRDEMVAMVLLGVTALVALIGVVFILRRRRRAAVGPGNEQL